MESNIYYTTRGIFGVKIYTYINKECNILFIQQLDTVMNNEMIEVAKAFYSTLTLSGPKRWKTNNFVSLLHIKFIMRSGKG
jgi:hypothetical protein